MGNVKLGNTGDEPEAPAQYPHTEGKRKKKERKESSMGLISYSYTWENHPGFLTVHTLFSTPCGTHLLLKQFA